MLLDTRYKDRKTLKRHDNMIIYIHNFKDSTEKLIGLITEICMYTHKISIQKLIAFLEIDKSFTGGSMG